MYCVTSMESWLTQGLSACMYTCVYIYVYTCVFMCICACEMHTYMCVHTHTCVSAHTDVYVYSCSCLVSLYIHVCIFVNEPVYLCACMFVCGCICVYTYMCICLCVHVYLCDIVDFASSPLELSGKLTKAHIIFLKCARTHSRPSKSVTGSHTKSKALGDTTPPASELLVDRSADRALWSPVSPPCMAPHVPLRGRGGIGSLEEPRPSRTWSVWTPCLLQDMKEDLDLTPVWFETLGPRFALHFELKLNLRLPEPW
jgi:hypothetical protein